MLRPRHPRPSLELLTSRPSSPSWPFAGRGCARRPRRRHPESTRLKAAAREHARPKAAARGHARPEAEAREPRGQKNRPGGLTKGSAGSETRGQGLSRRVEGLGKQGYMLCGKNKKDRRLNKWVAL